MPLGIASVFSLACCRLYLFTAEDALAHLHGSDGSVHALSPVPRMSPAPETTRVVFTIVDMPSNRPGFVRAPESIPFLQHGGEDAVEDLRPRRRPGTTNHTRTWIGRAPQVTLDLYRRLQPANPRHGLDGSDPWLHVRAAGGYASISLCARE